MNLIRFSRHALFKLAVVGSVWGVSGAPLFASVKDSSVADYGLSIAHSSLIARSREVNTTFKQGRELYNQYKYDEALKFFKQVTEQEPDFADAWYWLGMTLYNQRDYQNAIVSFKKATQIAAKNPTFWKARGDAMNALAQYTPERDSAIERYDLAVDAYDRALKFMPSNTVSDRAATWMGRSESLFAQGNLLVSQKDRSNALQKYQEAAISYDEVMNLAIANNDVNQQFSALWQKGEALRRVAINGEDSSSKKSLYRNALNSFDKAIELKSDFPDCWYRRGRILEELNQPKEALNSYDQAIHLDPDFAEALHWRGRLLARSRHFEAALDSFDRAVKGTIRSDWALETKLNPADIWYGRGVALYELKRYKQAVTSFDQAVKFKPDFPKAQEFRRNAQNQLNR